MAICCILSFLFTLYHMDQASLLHAYVPTFLAKKRTKKMSRFFCQTLRTDALCVESTLWPI
jgi:hypothetical protein